MLSQNPFIIIVLVQHKLVELSLIHQGVPNTLHWYKHLHGLAGRVHTMTPIIRMGLPLHSVQGIGRGVCVEGFSGQVPVSAMMGGTVTVVIHTALSTVIGTIVLGASVDTITGTDVVISV